MPVNILGARSRTLLTDNDGDGFADPGDVFFHTLIVTNSGDEDALLVEIEESENGYTIDPGSVLIGPIAMDDVFNITGNTPVIITKAQLIGNDIDPDGNINNASITNLSAGTNGTLVDNLDGTYTFTPTTGFNGVASFTYELADEDGVTSVEAFPGTVTINVSGLVWYVDSSSGSDATGDGSYAKPFATVNPLTTGGSADGLDGDGDIIFLYGGSAVSGNIVLEANQKLYGDSVALSVNGIAIGETTGNSDLNGSAGFTVTLATGNEINGIDIGGIGGITGTNFGTLTVNNSTIDTSGQAISLNTGTIAGNGFTSTDSDGGGSNVSFVSVNGTLSLGSGALANATTGANVSVNGGNISLTYNGAITQSQNASTVLVTNGHTGTLDFNGNVSATNGAGLQFNNADGTYRFDGAANSLNGGNAGIDILNGSTGTFVFDNLTLTHNQAGDAFTLQGSNANVTVNGTITDNNGRALNIDDHDGGTITFNAAINSSTATGQGILITDSAGTINFNGQIQLSTGANNALTMTNNTGANFTFAPGGLGLDITTTSGRGFFIEGGGTVRLGGSGNTISTGSGRAVEIDNATIGSGGFTLLSVNMTGGSTTGIFLNNAGSGGFTITGTGSTAASGGTIGSISGADGSVEAGIGIYINNTNNVSLSNIRMNGAYDNYGIRGTNVNNFTLRDSELTGTFGTNDSATLQEGTVSFGTQSSSTNGLTGTALFEGNVISNGFTNNLAVFNGGAGTLNMTVRDSANDQAVIGLNAINGNDGILVETRGNSVLVLEIDGVTFLGAKADMLQVIAAENTNQTLLIENNIFHNTHTATISGGGGITISGGGNTSNYTADYTIQNNSFRGAEGSNMFITYAGQNALVSGRILNNTIGINDGVVGTTQATTGSKGSGAGIWVETQNTVGGGNVNHAVRIEGNTIRDIVSSSTGAISLRANNFTNGGNRMEATILNNTISELGTFTFGGIYSMVGGQGAGDNGRMGLDIRNNTINLSAFPNGGGQPDGNAIILDQLSDTAFYYVPGYAGSQDGEFALSGPAGTASANLSTFWTTSPRVNTLTNGEFPNFAGGGVDATIVEGLVGNAFVLPIPILASHPEAADWEAELRATQEQALADLLAEQQPDGDTGGQEYGDDVKGDDKPVILTPPTDPAPADTGVLDLSQAQLDAIVEAAIERWIEAGATDEQVAAMRAATITVADMTGVYLASSSAGTIQIDNDGAGHGWFVDATPGEDDEYGGSGTRLAADADGAAAGRMDLLTVVMHELGHQVGLEDLYGSADTDELMYGYANLGERRLPAADDLIHADMSHAGHESFVLAPITVGTLPQDQAVRIVFTSTVDSFSNEIIPTFNNFSTISGDNFTDVTTANEALEIDSLTLGNLIFHDVDGNGAFDGADTGVDGVTLTLYADDGDTAGTFDANDTLLTTTTSAGGGLYAFTGLAPGDYIVVVDAANFQSGGALENYTSTTGSADPDDDVDNDDNGAPGAGGIVLSAPITLDYNSETVDDGSGQLDINDTLDFGFILPNQPPVIANLDGNNVDYTENDGFTQVDLGGDVDITDPDSGDFDGGSLTITVAGLIAGDEIRFNSNVFIDADNGDEVEVGGVAIGTLTVLANGWRIDFNSDATPDRVETVMRSIEYRNTTDNPSGTRTITWTLVDGDGTANGGDDDATVTSTVTILAVNDEPEGADNSDSVVENQDHVFTVANFATGFSDVEDHGFAGVVITTLPATGEIKLNGTAILAGDEISATQLGNGELTYTPDGGSAGTSPTFTFQVVDDGGTDNGGQDTDQSPNTFTIDITAADAAAVAQDDEVTTNENVVLNGDVFADNGNGADEDPDGPALEVSEVNGQAADVGSEIILASGAKLTLNADGTFAYDPNGQFNYLISAAKAAATGAVNTNAIDSFTYTLVNGNTATVTVTVNGVDSADDQLRGDSGDNAMVGTGGADLFILDQGGDDNASGGDGNDRFYFGAAFTNADSVIGGAGEDSLVLAGTYNLVFDANDIAGIERLRLLSGGGSPFEYEITMNDANVAAGARLRIDAQDLLATEKLTFLGQAETNGSFLIFSGAGDDVLVGGAGNDEIRGGAGNDRIYAGAGNDKLYGGMGADFLYGGAGRDIFIYNSAAESTGINFDTIDRLESRIDKIDLAGAFVFAGWTGNVGSGQLGTATFDADLAAAVNGAMQPNSAVLFTPDSGDFAGRTFAVVDADGDGNYQVGVDYVFEFSNPVEPPTSFSTLFF